MRSLTIILFGQEVVTWWFHIDILVLGCCKLDSVLLLTSLSLAFAHAHRVFSNDVGTNYICTGTNSKLNHTSFQVASRNDFEKPTSIWVASPATQGHSAGCTQRSKVRLGLQKEVGIKLSIISKFSKCDFGISLHTYAWIICMGI